MLLICVRITFYNPKKNRSDQLQEYLVSRHSETGRKQTQQAMELIEVNDQQYDEAEKLQASLQRKK